MTPILCIIHREKGNVLVGLALIALISTHFWGVLAYSGSGGVEHTGNSQDFFFPRKLLVYLCYGSPFVSLVLSLVAWYQLKKSSRANEFAWALNFLLTPLSAWLCYWMLFATDLS